MTTHDPEQPRWQYRLDNFKRAYFLLNEGVEHLAERGLSQLEHEGMVQRVEYTWELAWKTISDFLAHQGIIVEPITPRAVIRAAFEAGVINDGDTWMAALDARNKVAHTDNFKVFETVIDQVRDRFFKLFSDLYDDLTAKALEA